MPHEFRIMHSDPAKSHTNTRVGIRWSPLSSCRIEALVRNAATFVAFVMRGMQGLVGRQSFGTCRRAKVQCWMFRNEKSITCLKGLLTGGGARGLRFIRGTLHGLEVSSVKFVKTVLFELSKCRGRSGRTRVLNEHASVLNVVVTDFSRFLRSCVSPPFAPFWTGAASNFWGFLTLFKVGS